MRKKSVLVIACIAMLLVLIPQMAFATEVDSTNIETYDASRSVQGAMAGRYYENNRYKYEVITNMSSVMNMNGIDYGTFYMGVKTSSGFELSKDIESAEMIIAKNGIELARETIAVGEQPQFSGDIDGINYGVLCRTDDTGKVESLSGRIRFDLSIDAFSYYTELAGTYNLTFNWTAEGMSYVAVMNCSLTQGEMFSLIQPSGSTNGILTDYWGWAQDATETVSFDFNTLESYFGEHWDNEQQEWIDSEIKKLFVYTDSSMNGVFDFVSCSSSMSGLDEIFVQGSPIHFDEAAEVIPLCVRPHLMTENMIGKTCVLTFKKGNETRNVNLKIAKEDVSFLKNNTIYAVNQSYQQVVTTDSDGTVKLCCGDEGMESILENSAKLHMNEQSRKYVFIRYQNGNLVSVQMQAPTGGDAQKLGFILESDDNSIYSYRLEPLQQGSVYLKAKNSASLTVKCEIDFPYAAFFAKRERTESAFRTELHYIDAIERGSGEAYFYLMTPEAEWIDQGALKVSFTESYKNSDGQWQEREYAETGITFTPDGTYYDSVSKANFFVWKMTITEKFVESDEDNQWKNLFIYDKNSVEDDGNIYSAEYGYGGGVQIFDATEIPKDQKIYWFDKNGNTIVQDGKLVLNTTSGSLEQYAREGFAQWGAKGDVDGYFAVKKGSEYYIINTPVSSDAPSKVIISQAEDGAYKVKWRNTGRYLASATFDGKEYFLKMTINLYNTGFYTKNEPNERWLLDNEMYFNDAIEKKEDGHEAYFYLISDDWDLDASCKPVFVEWKYSTEEDGDYGSYVELEPVEGISFDNVEILEIGRKQYYSWKMAISDECVNGDFGEDFLVGFKKGDRILQSIAYIEIFGINAPEIIYGNVNGDDRESVDTADVLYLKRYLAGWNGYDNAEKRTADVNRDGLIDSADAMILERHVAGWKGFENLPVIKTQTESA